MVRKNSDFWLEGGKMKKEVADKIANKFYDKVKSLKRYTLTVNNPILPPNLPNWGIGVMYENGENAFDDEKITYITYNKTIGNFGKRLEEHFLMRNKSHRRSSWRNHVARAFINKNNDDSDLFDLWNGNSNFRRNYTRNLKNQNEKYVKEKLEEYENLVDKYLQGNFSFSIISCPTQEIQRRLRSRIIATLAQTEKISVSEDWLGKHSIDGELRQIAKNGIWNIECAKGKILTDDDFDLLDEYLEL